jgi:hypothetical protein
MLGIANRGLCAVAATPFINFALLDAYHPHPVKSFFSLVR